MVSQSDLKADAAAEALGLIDESILTLGLGSGSTAERFIRLVGEGMRAGRWPQIVGVATSRRSEALARETGIPIGSLTEHPALDLTVDGADEVTPSLDLIKGRGGALTREKIVAYASERYAIIIDGSKRVARLGERAPVPIEVLAFAQAVVERALRGMGGEPVLRLSDGRPYRTDEGNLILDCLFEGGLTDAPALAAQLDGLPGVVEHGLFLGMTDVVICASPDGIETLRR